MLNYYLSYYIFICVLVRYLCINTEMLCCRNHVSRHPNFEFSATIFASTLGIIFTCCEVDLKLIRRVRTPCSIEDLSVLYCATGTTNRHIHNTFERSNISNIVKYIIVLTTVPERVTITTVPE